MTSFANLFSSDLQLQVKDWTGETTRYKIPKTAKISIIFNKHAALRKMPLADLQFLLPLTSELISGDSTPEQMAMLNHAVITCCPALSSDPAAKEKAAKVKVSVAAPTASDEGPPSLIADPSVAFGTTPSAAAAAAPPAEEVKFVCRVRDRAGFEQLYRIKPSTPLGNMFDAYAAKRGVESSSLKFLSPQGAVLSPEDTATGRQLLEEDVLLALPVGHGFELPMTCSFCAKKASSSVKSLKMCVGCGVSQYCNKQCQSGAWPVSRRPDDTRIRSAQN